MFKIRKSITAFLLSAAVLTAPVAAYAEEESASDGVTQEEILIQSGDDDFEAGPLQQSLSAELDDITWLNNTIRELSGMNTDQISKEALEKIHDVYVALPDAGKAKVEGYDLVEGFINSFHLTFNESVTEEKADTGKKLDKEYCFQINNDRLSISVHYVSDVDGDGKAEMPKIKLISPKGKETEVASGTTTIGYDDVKISISWQEDFMQFDIESATNGLWKISTSEICVFNAFEYAGTSDSQAFTPVSDESKDDKEEYEDPSENPEKKGVSGSVMKLVLFLVGFSLFVILMIWLMRKFLFVDTGNSKNKSSKKSRKRYLEEDDYEEDEEDLSKERAEKEMRAMQEFLKKQEVSADYDDEEAGPEEADAIKSVFDDNDSEEAELEEYIEYPSGMVDSQAADEDDDDDFGNRF